ncbi:MAG: plasmid replication initiator TrfA [Lautropia sp.]
MSSLNSAEASPSLNTMLEKAEERSRARTSAQIITLPLWPEPKRGTPNSFVRSALFAAIQGKDRRFMKDEVLASQRGIRVRFTGEQLNQEDLSTFEALTHLSRQQPLGQVCEFTGYSLLRALDMATGRAQYEQLRLTIQRLTACAVEIEHDGVVYAGPLVQGSIRDERTGRWRVQLNRELVALFGESRWTAIDWSERMQLRRKPLAQALHAYYSSHAQPFPVKIETLRQFGGSANRNVHSFRQHLVKALEELTRIGFLQSFNVHDGMVMVTRSTDREQLPLPAR